MSVDSVGSSCLEEWQGEYVKWFLSITEWYDKIVEEGFHRFVFQSIILLGSTKNRHKNWQGYFYQRVTDTSIILDGVVQCSGLMVNDDDGLT